MTIKLSKEEKLDFFYRALCNGLGYIRNYGIAYDYNGYEYEDARERLESICHLEPILDEDILRQILLDGNSIFFKDLDGNCDKAEITLKLVYENMGKVEPRHLFAMSEELDEVETADAILQTIAYGEVQFGYN